MQMQGRTAKFNKQRQQKNRAHTHTSSPANYGPGRGNPYKATPTLERHDKVMRRTSHYAPQNGDDTWELIEHGHKKAALYSKKKFVEGGRSLLLGHKH